MIALLLNAIFWLSLMLSRHANAAIVIWGADGIMLLVGGFVFHEIWHAFFDPLVRLLGHISRAELIEIEKYSATYRE